MYRLIKLRYGGLPLLYLSASMETLQDAKDKKNLLVMPRTIAVLAGVLPPNIDLL